MNCWHWSNYVYYYVYARTSIYTKTVVYFHEYTYDAAGLQPRKMPDSHAQSNRACCVSSKFNKMCIPFVVFRKREERQPLACSSVVVAVNCSTYLPIICSDTFHFDGVAITAGLTAAGTGGVYLPPQCGATIASFQARGRAVLLGNTIYSLVLFMHAPVYHDINNYADIESMNKLQGLYPCSVISSYQKNEDIN